MMPTSRSHVDLLRLPLRVARSRSASSNRLLSALSFALPVAIVAAIASALPLPWWERATLAAFVIGGMILRTQRARMAERAPSGWVTADPTGLVRTDALGAARLVDWNARFGVTLLVNARRDRGLIAFTTHLQTRYVRVRASAHDSPHDSAAARELFARASLVSDADVTLGARGDDDAAISAGDAVRLIAAVRERANGALDRIFLSDARGASIALEGNELRAGDRIVDLGAPLEWRGYMFFESTGLMSTVMQATAIRQGAIELVLVAPMPAEASAVRRPQNGGGDTVAERAAARDLRLMHSPPDQPPPLDQRLAIERLFMVPIRRALDRAPRPSRVVSDAAPIRADGAESVPRSAS